MKSLPFDTNCRPMSLPGYPSFAAVGWIRASATLIFLFLVACSSDGGSRQSAERSSWLRMDSLPENLERCIYSSGPAASSNGALVVRGRRLNPCVIVQDTHVTVLGGSVTDTPSAPSTRVVRGSDGTFYTPAGVSQLGQVMRWNANGDVIATFGRRGNGPGEFAGSGDMLLFIGPGDSLFVVDDENRWTVLDRDLTYGRTFQGLHAGRWPDVMHVSTEGRIVTTGPTLAGGSSGRQVYVMDGDGRLENAFGSLPQNLQNNFYYLGSTSADGGGETVWIPRFEVEKGRLLLEQWALSGELIKTIVRESSWTTRRSPDSAAPMQNPHAGRPRVALTAVDGNGLLWIGAVVLDQGDEQLYVLEVFDPASGEIVASAEFGDDDSVPFRGMFPGTTTFYNFEEDDLGFTRIEIFEVDLFANPTFRQ